MDLAKLVMTLPGAKEGSEYLDYAIQRVLFGMTKPVPEYTRSLDAAMRLIPEGWSIHRLSQISDCRGGFAGWIGDIYRAGDAMLPFPTDVTCATAPLALAFAALRVIVGEAKERELGLERLQRSGT